MLLSWHKLDSVPLLLNPKDDEFLMHENEAMTSFSGPLYTSFTTLYIWDMYEVRKNLISDVYIGSGSPEKCGGEIVNAGEFK